MTSRTQVISELIDTDLKALINLTKKTIKIMEKQKSGTIINFASSAGKHAAPRLLPYSAAKSAIITFTEGIQKEARAKGLGIIAYAICPESVLTNMHYHMTAQEHGVTAMEVEKSLKTDNPIGTPLSKLLVPEEVAEKVVNLLTGRIKIGKGSCLNIRK
ncbi:MAG: SDR family oxidoreductase [Actinomycetota bacterium]|nr:SDR family oxidoreductase [Actinomycetota bacterium]